MSANGYLDYFSVLGVERGADADAIKRAFRKLARQYHPDVNPGDAGAEAKFKEVSEAYEVLSDPDKRRRYEQFGQYWSQAGGGSASGGVDVDFGRYGNFDDFINDLLGRFGGPSPVVPRAVLVSVQASLVALLAACPAAAAAPRSISMPKPASASPLPTLSAVPSAPWPSTTSGCRCASRQG